MTCDVERGVAPTVSGVGPPLTTLAVLLLVVAAGCARDTGLEREAPNYRKEAVTFASDGIQLSGILWTPKRPGPHPALVLVDGSGKTTAGGMEPWAHRFSGWGFACLSYDKRGVGRSGGRYIGGYDIDVPLLGRDAAAGVEYLKTRAGIDDTRIGLLGASQAGWVIPVAAVASRDVAFTVIYSGATVSLGEEAYFSRRSGDDPVWNWIYRDLSLDELSRRLATQAPSLFDPIPYLKRLTVPWALALRRTGPEPADTRERPDPRRPHRDPRQGLHLQGVRSRRPQSEGRWPAGRGRLRAG